VTRVRHPVFARFYQRIAAFAEKAGASEHRDRLLAGSTGVVAEVGSGHGVNFPHYPTSVSEVIAIEPEPFLRARAQEAAVRALVPVSVVDGDADHLPLEDASVDAVVSSLVLCSVPDQQSALAEMRRVLRSDGELRFYEHVRASDPRWARRQRLAQPVWSCLGGGCHLTRDTLAAIERAGFVVDKCEHFLFQPCLTAKLSAPTILGSAHRT
jgi:ubiquinone/menaquinone biosynthesis C-methylase UbiE